jgi:hypothetical protein
VTPDFHRTVQKILEAEEVSTGWLRGKLDAINVHGENNVLYLYPDFGPKKVRCTFPAELFGAAKEGIGRFVEAHGVLKYKQAADYPHELTIKRLEVLPNEEELPTLWDLRGAASSVEPNEILDAHVAAIEDASFS